ncbi:MAG: FHA domain-containing protein, partial [Sedimentisphaerales bacterium]|nr:FHA domain-containing protein [Sedimentisphaerales bacterium]
MRLILRTGDGTTKEFQFGEGPVSIGRQSSNQVFLPDKAVSKQHAVITVAEDGKWMVEDLDSANKTYLNDKAVNKAEIKTGDILRITEFTVEIDLEENVEADGEGRMEDTLHLEAALTTPRHETIVRKPDAAHAPAMRLAAKRLSDFSHATEAICEADSLDKLLTTLLDITLKQFSAFRCWCALRDQPGGPMTYHSGRRRDGRPVELSDLQLNEKINDAVERGLSMVMPSVSAKMEEKERIRSALIASVMRPNGCYGILYVDNA